MMSNIPVESCDACGGTLRLRGGPGRFINYRRGVRLEIPTDLVTLTCDSCGDMVLDGPTVEAVEVRLSVVYAIMRQQPRSLQLDLDLAQDLPPNSRPVVGVKIEIRGRAVVDTVPPNLAPLHAA